MVNTDFRNPTALASSSSTRTWVIDSGTTDHKRRMHPNFHTYAQISHGRVCIADGTFMRETREGTIDVLSNLSLSSVLHAPQFSFNLKYVSSLTKNHNCSVKFYPSHCVFQDLRTGQMIGGGRESNCLYILELIGRESKVFHSSTEWEKAMLWHRRLGHAPLLSLREFFFSLNISHDVKELNCETCQ